MRFAQEKVWDCRKEKDIECSEALSGNHTASVTDTRSSSQSQTRLAAHSPSIFKTEFLYKAVWRLRREVITTALFDANRRGEIER